MPGLRPREKTEPRLTGITANPIPETVSGGPASPGLTFEVPVQTYSTNRYRRAGWQWTRRQAKAEHKTTALAYRASGRYSFDETATLQIRLTRFHQAHPLDDDNLRGAVKAIRDALTLELGFEDDSDPRLIFHYSQQKRPASDGHGVRVDIWTEAPPE